MPDDPIKPDPAAGDPPADPPQGGKPDELPEGAKKALEAARAEAKAFEKRAKEAEKAHTAAQDALKAAQDAGKTDLEKLTERMTRAEERAAKAEHESLRAAVIAAKGLPPEAARRLTGTTQEELEADADELIELLQPSQKAATAGSFAGGQRAGGTGSTEAPDMNAWLRERYARK